MRLWYYSVASTGYQQAKRGSAVVGATEGKLVSKPKTDPSDPITECLVSYGSQIADYADRLYAGQDIPTGLQFTRAVKTFQQVNEEWDMHSRVMFDIADLTHVPITLRFMQGDAPLVGAGYSTTFPLELRPREYSVLAAHAAAQERAAA